MTNFSCPSTSFPSSNYLDSPEFLKLALHTVTATSTPIYLLGVYSILFKTPKPMESVKWYIFTLHFWILLYDYSVGVLIVPFLLMPHCAGTTLGVLASFGVSTLIQAMFGILVLYSMFISITSIFENRFFIICQFRGKQYWRVYRKLWLFLMYSAHFCLIFPVVFLIPDQEKARLEVFQNLPCLPTSIYQSDVLVIASDSTYQVSIALVMLFFFCLQNGFFITQLILNGREQQKSQTTSLKTYQMHQQLFRALVLQMTIPLLMLVFPLSFGYSTLYFDYYNQAAIHACVISIVSHGALSTVVMIVVHKPYRLAVTGMMKGKDSRVSKISLPPTVL